MSAADWKARSNRGLPGRVREPQRKSAEVKRLELLIGSAQWEREQIAVRLIRGTIAGTPQNEEDLAAFRLLEERLLGLECDLLITQHADSRQHHHGY